jgi:hypothetical protein
MRSKVLIAVQAIAICAVIAVLIPYVPRRKTSGSVLRATSGREDLERL